MAISNKDRTLTYNYRHISLVTTVGKIAERIILRRIEKSTKKVDTDAVRLSLRTVSTAIAEICNIEAESQHDDSIPVHRRSQDLRPSLARHTHLQNESTWVFAQSHPDGGLIPNRPVSESQDWTRVFRLHNYRSRSTIRVSVLTDAVQHPTQPQT